MRTHVKGQLIAASIHLIATIAVFILMQTAFYEMSTYDAAFFYKPLGYSFMYIFLVTDFPVSYIFLELQIRSWVLLLAQLVTSLLWGVFLYSFYTFITKKEDR